MSRTIWLALLVAVLGVGAYFVVQQQSDGPATSVVGWDRDFSVPYEKVHKIFLADRNGNTTTLERKGPRWIFNEKYNAREDAVRNLLGAITSIEMAYVPTKAAVPVMVKTLATHGIKVEIYDEQDKLQKAYYVGGATNREDGTYVIMDGSDQPYVAHLPHWTGNLRYRYNLSGDTWRSREVFGQPLGKIANVSIEYPKQRDKSFRLSVADANVEPYYPLTPKRAEAPDPNQITRFVSRLQEIQMTRYFNYGEERNDVIKQIPFAIFNIEEVSGQRYSLKLFPQLQNTVVDPKTGLTDENQHVGGYYGWLNEEDFILVQGQNAQKMLWGYNFFFNES